MTCEHKNFRAHVEIHRLEDSGNFLGDVTVKCGDCGAPFQFSGFARMSTDKKMARLGLHEAGKPPQTKLTSLAEFSSVQ